MRYFKGSDIFGREFTSRESPLEITLTEAVPEVVEFRPTDNFSGQSAGRNSTTSGTASVRVSS